MFIEQAYRAKNNFWRYLIGSLIIALVAIIGQLFFAVAVIMKSVVREDGTMDPNAFEDLQSFSEDELMHTFSSNITFFLLLSSFALAFIAIILVIKFLHEQNFKSVTTTRIKFDWGRFFFAFSLIAGFSIVTTAVDYFVNPEDYVFNFKPVTFAILFLIAIVLIPIQTSVEEYIFRGYLMQGFGILAKNRWFPLVLTSVIFGGMHFFNPEVTKLGNILMIYYIGTGFLLGIMTLMDEGMELSLGFHAANNLIAAVLVTSDWQVFQTEAILIDISEPSAGFDVLIPVVLIYPIFLGILAYKYNWNNWKEKLFGKLDPPVSAENKVSEAQY